MSLAVWLRGASCLGALALALAGPVVADERGDFDAIDLGAPLGPDALAERLAPKRVVFVGEQHGRFSDHVNQLRLIERIYARDPNIAIGVEYLQRRFQSRVDEYIAGDTSEQTFLRDTEYYRDWGYDYRLYAPIFRYARERHIPVQALNVPPPLAAAVAKVGIDGLSAEQRADLPKKIGPASDDYRARLRAVFDAHGRSRPGDFEHFVEAQLVWDEGMAESASAYLEANPGRRMVILTGSGHVAFGAGIPQRLHARTGASYAVLLNGGEEIRPGMADYALLSEEQTLPPAGVLGARLDDKNGQCLIAALSPGGAADRGGLKDHDVLVTIDGQAVETAADVRLAIWAKKPGDHVTVDARRKRRHKTVELQLDIELAASAHR